jgi:hypothetical protein
MLLGMTPSGGSRFRRQFPQPFVSAHFISKKDASCVATPAVGPAEPAPPSTIVT